MNGDCSILTSICNHELRSATRVPVAPRPRAFTLVELLVTIAVIAVLLGILLPALAAARRSAGSIALQSNQRESGRLLSLYSADHDGLFPSYGLPGTMVGRLEWQGEVVTTNWWSQIEYWGLFLQTRGYDGWVSAGPGATPTVFDNITCGSCGQGRSIYLMTAAALGEPELFKPDAEDRSALHIPQRIHRVAYPSQKGLLVHLRGFREDRVSVSFADDHIEVVDQADLAPGVSGELPFAPLPVVTTERGLLGRDI